MDISVISISNGSLYCLIRIGLSDWWTLIMVPPNFLFLIDSKIYQLSMLIFPAFWKWVSCNVKMPIFRKFRTYLRLWTLNFIPAAFAVSMSKLCSFTVLCTVDFFLLWFLDLCTFLGMVIGGGDLLLSPPSPSCRVYSVSSPPWRRGNPLAGLSRCNPNPCYICCQTCKASADLCHHSCFVHHLWIVCPHVVSVHVLVFRGRSYIYSVFGTCTRDHSCSQLTLYSYDGVSAWPAPAAVAEAAASSASSAFCGGLFDMAVHCVCSCTCCP